MCGGEVFGLELVLVVIFTIEVQLAGSQKTPAELTGETTGSTHTNLSKLGFMGVGALRRTDFKGKV